MSIRTTPPVTPEPSPTTAAEHNLRLATTLNRDTLRRANRLIDRAELADKDMSRVEIASRNPKAVNRG
jgi:hypothetical protein